MNMNTRRIFALVAAILVVAVGASIYVLKFSKSVEVGDTVLVNYTAHLDTGEIFDTTLEEVALDDTQPKVWWFRLRASYTPLKIIVGQGAMPPDFEMALIGLHEGDEKEIAIPPQRAVGLRDPAKITEVPLVQKLDKEEEVSREEFVDKLRQEPIPDEQYDMYGLAIYVLEVTEEKVRFHYVLEVGQEIHIALGKALVTDETETQYEITLTPTLGDVVYSAQAGQGVVTEIREDAMLVDFNPLLAGETLHYTIWLVEIEKAD